jgi:glycyl-tRNA synthetase
MFMKNNDLSAEKAGLMEKIVSLCKRRGFIFPGSEIYGGFANSWDYGPVGVELKNNIKQLWWKRFVQSRDDMVGIDAALIMKPVVWEASGHLKNFSDPLIECKKCNSRFRVDHLLAEASLGKAIILPTDINQLQDLFIKSDIKCPNCKAKDWSNPKQFNLMFKTFIGPAEEQANIAYFRPETAQAMFVDFKNVLDTSRKTVPFGIAQIGKAFRNEITPGNFIFRTREFEQMEIEYFIPVPKADKDWNKYFEDWRKQMLSWISDDLGIKLDHVHELEVPESERAHYSKRTIDFEYDFPFGKSELYGLAYRGDFDLKNHQEKSGQSLEYTDPQTSEKYLPHVIEPTWGVDRSVLAVLCEFYREEEDPPSASDFAKATSDKKASGGKRVVLALPPRLASYKVAVFPLLKNKPELVAKAREIYDELRKTFTVAWDERGNVGKRYYSQDEIGTPFCITVDFDSLEDGTVTVRNRDTKEQPRVKIEELRNYLQSKIN